MECCFLKSIYIKSLPFWTSYVIVPWSSNGPGSPVLHFEHDPSMHWTKGHLKLTSRHLVQRYLFTLAPRWPDCAWLLLKLDSSSFCSWSTPSPSLFVIGWLLQKTISHYFLSHYTILWDIPKLKMYLKGVQTTHCLSITVGQDPTHQPWSKNLLNLPMLMAQCFSWGCLLHLQVWERLHPWLQEQHFLQHLDLTLQPWSWHLNTNS